MATHAKHVENEAPGRSEAETCLATRRSTAPDCLAAPGPNSVELDRIIEIALRVPDHGRLGPWRLIVIAEEAKTRWLTQLMELAETRPDAPKARASAGKLQSAPLVVVVVSSPNVEHKVPVWEQTLSAGAVCMNLLNGAAAMGFGANWLTGWLAYDPKATVMLDLADHEKVAGMVLIGSIGECAPERERARAERVVTRLEA